MGKFKLILWDIGNVLNHADHAITHQRLERLGVPREKAVTFFTTPAYGDFARGRLTGLDFWYHQVIENLRCDLTLLDINQVHDAHMYQPDPDTLALLPRCKVPIAFATSTNVWQNRRERELIGDLDRFNPVWTFRSNEQGMLKTDPGCMSFIADELCRRAKVHASEILFIDDSPGNRAAAERVGIFPFAYEPNVSAGACEEYLRGLDLLT